MSVANRRRRERAERRSAILEAAARVFFSKGFQAATMEEVASEAELSKGTLYLYFKNKDDLFLALSAQVLDGIVARFEQIAARPHVPGLQLIRELLTAYTANAEDHPDHFRTVVSWISTGYQVDTSTASFGRHRAQISKLVAALVGTLQRGQTDGSIRAELDPVQTAAQVWASLFGVLQVQINRDELNRRFPQPIDFSGFVTSYVDLLCEGLRARGSEAES